MYIQITKACNMSCAHCSFSCEVGKWVDSHMDWETYCRAIELCEQYAGSISIGGGEPTIHPEFWKYLRTALRADVEGVWLATNGKKPSTALLLAHLAGDPEEAFLDLLEVTWDEEEEEVLDELLDPRVDGTCPEDWKKFSCTVSRDQYHAMIDPAVFEAFTRHGQEIRDNTFHLSNIGAAKENQLFAQDHCGCSSVMVEPDGTIKMCGCPNSLVLGSVYDDGIEDILDRYYGTLDTWEVDGEDRDGHGECGNPDFGFSSELGEYILHGSVENEEAA